MKSILFTHFREKLLDRTKQQTIRMLMLPGYIISEMLLLRFKHENNTIEELFIVLITELFPLQIKNIDHEIAVRDGFESVEECIWGLASINGGIYKKTNTMKPHFTERWAFVTRWIDAPKKQCAKCGKITSELLKVENFEGEVCSACGAQLYFHPPHTKGLDFYFKKEEKEFGSD